MKNLRIYLLLLVFTSLLSSCIIVTPRHGYRGGYRGGYGHHHHHGGGRHR